MLPELDRNKDSVHHPNSLVFAGQLLVFGMAMLDREKENPDNMYKSGEFNPRIALKVGEQVITQNGYMKEYFPEIYRPFDLHDLEIILGKFLKSEKARGSEKQSLQDLEDYMLKPLVLSTSNATNFMGLPDEARKTSINLVCGHLLNNLKMQVDSIVPPQVTFDKGKTKIFRNALLSFAERLKRNH